ncbi:MAG: carbohydrate binding family 9 domain-containing protein [Bacteroidales bacterium]|nr:carbohydrate binding family 9 domain-containing protein [Bacteroidales bacterium]
MDKSRLFFLLLLVLLNQIMAQQLKEAFAFYANNPPRIDGYFLDSCWKISYWYDGFLQKSPFHGKEPSQQTFFSIVYTNEGIYVAVFAKDSEPRKILRQLGKKDDDLNADQVTIFFDPYLTKHDAYAFQVYASGTQADYRFEDHSYNAIWKSATVVHDSGWNAEIFIPYNAFRFPKKDEQEWGLQIQRIVRRTRELSQWALEEQNVGQPQLFWGVLKGLKNIYPPLRLSLHPYASVNWQKNENGSFISYGGGMDLKWGINESFTLDVTLLPDFHHVRTDELIKNLSPFETYYSEQREFFKEGIELFTKGNFFYSRRIGKKPNGYYAVFYQVDSTDEIIENPDQAKLLNAFKLSGRTSNGLGIGFFNAFVQNTYAKIRHQDGSISKILTEPQTNYNIVVIDKQWKNGNSLYFINTNSYRPKAYPKNNVSAIGKDLYFIDNRFKFSILSALTWNDTSSLFSHKPGKALYTSLSKVRGNWQGSAGMNMQNQDFNYNDLGYQNIRDFHKWYINASHTWFNPFEKARFVKLNANLEGTWKMSKNKLMDNSFSLNFHMLTMSYFYCWSGAWINPAKKHDFYEPRISGWFYIDPIKFGSYGGFSTSYSKPFAMDGNFSCSYTPTYEGFSYYLLLSSLMKFGNHIEIRISSSFSKDKNDIGYALIDSVPVFGNRSLLTFENSLTLTYTIINNMQLSLLARHYYNTGKYHRFFVLDSLTGTLKPTSTSYPVDYGFNFFSVDILYSFEFMPGNYLQIAFKPNALLETNNFSSNYISAIHNIMQKNWNQVLSLKCMFYLDYFYLRKRLNRPS